MKKHTLYVTIGVIFSLILILHLARIIFGWSAVIGGLAIPMWASWIAVAAAVFLLYQGYRLRKQF